MSWWQSVVNTVKEVATNIVPSSTGYPGNVCGVAQFQVPIYARPNNQVLVGVSAGEVGEGTSHSTASSRITTRARITYELDRYQKNAMLLFVHNLSDSDEGCRIQDLTDQEVSELVETFTCFRFEVDIQTDLTCGQVEQKCREFFQRDFRQYGAVVVVVLSFAGTHGQLSARDGRFSEATILRHFTDDLNPTLLAKPKIYITEANRTGDSVLMGNSLPLEEHHQDILGVHIPLAVYSGNGIRRPLLRLCDNIKEMADSRDFVSIVKKTIEDVTRSISVFEDKPIELNNNLTKDMVLAKSS